jgi:hypothetical protein
VTTSIVQEKEIRKKFKSETKAKAIQRANIANIDLSLAVYGDTEMLNVTKS